MKKTDVKKLVLLLIVVSALIYGVQLLVFRDPKTTGFYILQDIAFMPFTIAIATIVVGELLNAKEKKERLEKTQMLTSSFFSELGAPLVMMLLGISDCGDVRSVFSKQSIDDEKSLQETQALIREAKLSVRLSEDSYTRLKKMILEQQTALLVISSNPLLLEHEDFTKMLWGLFHLIDEFRLRGEFEELSRQDINHLQTDLADVLRLLLISWAANILYTKRNYPAYYNAALSKLDGIVNKNP